MNTKAWAPGTQCIAKCDHTKPKLYELRFEKGDILTIIEATQNKGQYRAKHNKTCEEGLISSNAVREREAIRADPALSLMPWFHGKISGPDAVQLLQPPEDGLFLVRESVRHQGDYVLCVCYQNDVVHYRVIYQEKKLTIDEGTWFCNLIDMVEYYMKNQGAICTQLAKPKPKEGTKSAEKELSKAGWLLDMEKLKIEEKVGEGEFGAVYKGDYMGQTVAIKNIKCDVTAQSFLAETAVMTKIQHKNLVRLLGVILQNELYIVTEFMGKGSLLNYLRTRGRSLITEKQLIQFAYEVCEGMEYLESKKLVHRDLAARNILISEEIMAKVSDFGLVKADPKKDDNAMLPVKWTAPEALKSNKFSTKSDVWSYGILLWEIFSFGKPPYPRMSLKDVKDKVLKGYHMESPEECPASIYNLMKNCWELDPGKRPAFKKLKGKLEKELRSTKND